MKKIRAIALVAAMFVAAPAAKAEAAPGRGGIVGGLAPTQSNIFQNMPAWVINLE